MQSTVTFYICLITCAMPPGEKRNLMSILECQKKKKNKNEKYTYTQVQNSTNERR